MAEREGKRAARRWARRLALALGPVLALGGASVALVLDREDGIGTLIELRRQARYSHARVDRLSAEKERLSSVVRGLRSDPDQVEAAARSRLGMLRPGEVVVRMPSAGRR